ncbi:MAG: hypothetical protein Q9220_005764 [cf. Caloplaca sp. 1 TL-2023]
MDCPMWKAAAEAKFQNKGSKFTKEDWDTLLGNYEAVADLPPAAFIPELHEAYPDAKVVIIQRDPSSWYTSCSKTVMRIAESSELKMLSYVDRGLASHLAPMLYVLFDSVFGTEYKDPVKKKQGWIQGYNDTYDEARRVVPKEQRLEFSLDQGWEPLCDFLGKEIPQKPFPRDNDSASFDVAIRGLINKMWVRAAQQSLPYLVIGGMTVALLSVFQ